MTDQNRFDHLIKKYASQYRLPWLLIKAQVWAESGFDPDAVSPCGAKGLMQLMPGTAEDMQKAEGTKQKAEDTKQKSEDTKQKAEDTKQKAEGSEQKAATEINLFEPEINIDLGMKYDRWLYDRFPEIPEGQNAAGRKQNAENERLKFMLAAYNCGRGYVNQALRLAREAEFGFQPLALIRGQWQTWEYSCTFLSVPVCEVNGERPDYRQVWDYVEKIWTKYREYAALSQ